MNMGILFGSCYAIDDVIEKSLFGIFIFLLVLSE